MVHTMNHIEKYEHMCKKSTFWRLFWKNSTENLIEFKDILLYVSFARSKRHITV